MGEIRIGKKPTLAYAMSALLALQRDSEVVIKARGRATARAIDVAEVLRRKLLTDIKVKSVSIGTDEIEDSETKQKISVSTIEIALTK